MVEKIKLHSPFEDKEFRILESNLKLIADKAEREHALQGIENLKKSYLIAENELAKIHLQQIQEVTPPSKIKLFFLTLFCAIMTYIFGVMALMPVLEQGGYTLKRTGEFINAVSTPIQYWFAVGFFALCTAFMMLLFVGCVLAIITFPVPPLHRYKELRNKK